MAIVGMAQPSVSPAKSSRSVPVLSAYLSNPGVGSSVLAKSLKAIHNVKLAPACDALIVVCPEHHRTFRNAGWSKARLLEQLYRLCEIPGNELIAGAKGIAEGGPPSLAGKIVNKFRPGGLMIVHAGGDAGMFSGIIGGWSAGGERGSLPVTREIKP